MNIMNVIVIVLSLLKSSSFLQFRSVTNVVDTKNSHNCENLYIMIVICIQINSREWSMTPYTTHYRKGTGTASSNCKLLLSSHKVHKNDIIRDSCVFCRCINPAGWYRYYCDDAEGKYGILMIPPCSNDGHWFTHYSICILTDLNKREREIIYICYNI